MRKWYLDLIAMFPNQQSVEKPVIPFADVQPGGLAHLTTSNGTLFFCWGGLAFRHGLLPNDLYQHPLPPPPVKLAIENLFPRAEIEFAFGDADDDLAAHDLAFHVRVGVVLAGAVVLVLGGWRVRRQLFQPNVIVVKQTVFGIVDINAGGAMRCLFAICTSKPGVHHTPAGGNARKSFQHNHKALESTSRSKDYSFI